MTRRIAWVSLVVVAVATAAIVVVTIGGGQASPIKIGVLYNSSGGMKWLDRPGLEGFRLAADQINAQGGVVGRQVEVVEMDGTTDTTEMTRLATRLVSRDDISAIAGVNEPLHAISPIRGALRRADGGLITFEHSEMALAVGEVTEAAEIPFVTAGSTLSTLPGLIGDDVFMVAATHDAQVAAAARYARDELGARRAWILVDEGHDFATSLAASFETHWQERGGEVVGTDSYPPGELDISAQIEGLQGLALQPEVILIASLQNEGGYLVKQLREAGVSQPILFADVVDPRYIVAMGGNLSDVFMATQGSLRTENEAVAEFIGAYQAKYQHAPESTTAMLGYDTMRLIADAIQRAGSPEPGRLSESLAETVDFAALTGNLSYPDPSHVPVKTVTILTYRDATPTVAAEIAPS